MRTEVVHHESPELGRLERRERAPHPVLSGIVHRYCGFDHAATGVARRREVAQDQVTIILLWGAPLGVGGPTQRPASFGSFVAPLADTYAITEEHGSLTGIQVDLSPLGAHRVLGLPMNELGCSRRHLASRFRETIGVGPKTAGRLMRFQRAVRRLERDDGARLAEIAADCGYYDQAHLNREFRALAGATPGDHVGRLLPDRFGVAAG